MFPFFPRRLRLLREQLHDELLLHRDLDVLPDRQPPHRSLLLVDVQLEPRWNRRAAGGQIVRDALLHLGSGPDLDDLAHPDDVGGNGHLAPADLDVAVSDHLAALASGGRHAQPEHHVVQSPLQQLQQVLAGDPFLGLGPGEVAPELRLEHAVDPLGLLLFPQLHAVGRGLAAAESVLPRRVVAALDGALLGEAARALEKELDPLAPALPAHRDVISCHRVSPYTRRRLGGRQPLCGIGVTSRMAVISSPTACSDRMAASRPDPGPRTYTSTCLSPSSMALRAAFSAAVWAAKGVLFREPLTPALPGGRGRFLLRGFRHARGSLSLRAGGGGTGGRHRPLLDHDALAPSLAGAGVRVRALAADGQALAVADAAVAPDVHEALDAHGDLATQVALHLVLALEDVADAARLIVAPVLDALVGVHAGFGEDLLGRRDADPVDVLNRDLAPLVTRQIHSGDTCHAFSPNLSSLDA